MKNDETLRQLAGRVIDEGVAYFRIDGRVYLVMPTARHPHRRMFEPEHPAQAIPRLTPMQQAVLELAATGLTLAEMGEELGLAANTINQHLQVVRRAFGVTRTTKAVEAARELGVL